MDVSGEKLELIEKIRNYRGCVELEETLKQKNNILKQDREEIREAMIDLRAEMMDQIKLLDKIKDLEKKNRELELERQRALSGYDFIITTPHESTSVYGEIRKQLSQVQEEVMVCSPWITYLVDEFKDFNRDITLKVIANFRREDIKKGITDLDKLRVLKDLGADIRYNNNLHAKMLFIDSQVAIISSANLTRRGLSVNYEAGVIIRNLEQVNKALEFFNGVWEESQPLTTEMIHKMGE